MIWQIKTFWVTYKSDYQIRCMFFLLQIFAEVWDGVFYHYEFLDHHWIILNPKVGEQTSEARPPVQLSQEFHLVYSNPTLEKFNGESWFFSPSSDKRNRWRLGEGGYKTTLRSLLKALKLASAPYARNRISVSSKEGVIS